MQAATEYFYVPFKIVGAYRFVHVYMSVGIPWASKLDTLIYINM